MTIPLLQLGGGAVAILLLSIAIALGTWLLAG